MEDGIALVDRWLDSLEAAGVPAEDPRWGQGVLVRANCYSDLGRLDEGMSQVQKLIDQARQHDWDVLRKALLHCANLMMRMTRNSPRVKTIYEEARTLALAAGDPMTDALCVEGIARALEARGDVEQGVAMGTEAADRFAAMGDIKKEANVRSLIGLWAVRRGDLDSASSSFARSVELGRLGAGKRELSDGLRGLGVIAASRDDLVGARALLEEALEVAESVRHLQGTASTLNDLGDLERRLGNPEAANDAYERAGATLDVVAPNSAFVPRLNQALVLMEAGEFPAAAALLDAVLASGIHRSWTGVAHALMLPCAVASGDDLAWGDHYGRARAALEISAMATPDVAKVLEMAGELSRSKAEGHDRPRPILSQAARAHAMALSIWLAMGNAKRAAAQEAVLVELARIGAPIPVGPFDLERKVGQGGMGEVWLTSHRASGSDVAVKVITADRARSEAAVDALSRETFAVARLQHPNIATVVDTGVLDRAAEVMSDGHFVEGSPFMAMEYADGGTVKDLKSLDWPTARDVLMSTLDALAHAHARGVVHLDVKPDNILLSGGQAKLADFGIAMVLGDDDAALGAAGTPAFMAPEMCLGRRREVGPWSDLYAVGCVAVALTQGQPPFVGPQTLVLSLHVDTPPPPLKALFPVPAGFQTWVYRCLAKHPANRFTRASDAAQALDALGEATEGAGSATSGLDWTATTFNFGELPQTLAIDEPVQGFPKVETSLPNSWRPVHTTSPARTVVQADVRLFDLRPPPFVGRLPERDLLWATLVDVAASSRARAVVVRGPAGIGRTRLAHWLAERAHECGRAETAIARLDPEGPGLPGMVRSLLRAGRLSGEPLVDHIGWMLQVLRPDLPETGVHARVLADFLDQRGGTEGGVATSARLLGLLARERPLVLVLDDVHWNRDAIRLALLLMREYAGRPLLVVATVRSDLVDDGTQNLLNQLVDAGARVEDLEPLSDDESGRLLTALLRTSSDLRERVVSRTEGNPRFIVHLLADWVQRGLLRQQGPLLSLRLGADPPLPNDLHALWAQRVSLLISGLDGARSALEIAAVLGLEFDNAEWKTACANAHVALSERLLHRLIERHLAVILPSGAIRFSQSMMRESLLRAAKDGNRTRGWHGACVDAVVDSSRRRGLHFWGAGRPAEALEPLATAAEADLIAMRWERARRLMETWQRCADAAGVREGDPRMRRIHRIFASIATHSGQVERGLELWRSAVAYARAADNSVDTVQTLLGYARALRIAGQFDYAEAVAHEALTLAATSGLGAEIGTCHVWLGITLRQRGDTAAAIVHFREGVRHGSELAGLELAYSLIEVGNLDEGEPMARRALAFFEKSGHLQAVGMAVICLAEIAMKRGDLDENRRLHERAMDLAGPGASRGALFGGLNYAVSLVVAHEDYKEARIVLESLRTRSAHRGLMRLQVGISAGLLAAGAVELDEVAWATEVSTLLELLQQTGIFKPVVADCCEIAGRRCQNTRPDRAARAFEIAVAQWNGCGRSADADRVAALF